MNWTDAAQNFMIAMYGSQKFAVAGVVSSITAPGDEEFFLLLSGAAALILLIRRR